MGFRYLGNKSRLADWLVDCIATAIPPGAKVADPMCGTATVSLALANAGFQVTAADALRFPVIHARARLLAHSDFNFEVAGGSVESAIQSLNSVEPVKGFFWREYSADGKPQNGSKPRKYFTGDNAARIDAMRALITYWQETGLTEPEAELLLHQLILAVNKVANIAGTYGYYRSSFTASSLTHLALEVPAPPARGPQHHRVLQGRIEDVAPNLDAELCYLDPPYTKRQYAGNYHLLETLAMQDEPEPVGEGGLRDWYPQHSDFCSKRKVRDAFHRTLSRLKTPIVALSYSEDGLVPSEELKELLAEYGKVSRHELALPRFRSNNGKSNKPGAVHEHLYILEHR